MSVRKTVVVFAVLLATAVPAWSQSTLIEYPGARHTRPQAISATGAITGVWVSREDGRTHGFVFDGGEYTSIDYPGAIFTSAQGINPAGDVVGLYVPAGQTEFRGYLYSQGQFSPIEIPGAINVRPFGINPQGDIVGGYVGADLRSHGFVLRQGVLANVDPPASLQAALLDIDPQGHLLGRYQQPAGVFHTFLVADGEFISLDVPGSLNNGGMGARASLSPKGDVVSSYVAADGRLRGVLIDADGFWPIDFPNTQFTIATGLNARGDIVGWYRDPAGFDHGFLAQR
jgi:hypothetical protein